MSDVQDDGLPAEEHETKPQDKKVKKQKTKRPKSWAVLQQRMKAYHPILTPKSIIPIFLLTGIVFIPIGIFVFFSNTRVVSYGPYRYDEDYQSEIGNDCFGITENATCNITLNIAERMEAPVYFYYHLTNFYQNHRRYINSKSDKQLLGERLGWDDLDGCSPLIGIYGDECRTTGDCDQDIYIPCGLIANSFFSDVFRLYTPDLTSEIPIESNGIAWWSDKQFKFGNPGGVDVLTNETWVNYKGHFAESFPFKVGERGFRDERFINWMHVSALPNFKKLYGIVRQDINPGNYSLSVDYHFMTEFFKGTKSFEFSTVSWMGGNNALLAYAYLAVGISCLIISVGLLILVFLKPMKMGDPANLSFPING